MLRESGAHSEVSHFLTKEEQEAELRAPTSGYKAQTCGTACGFLRPHPDRGRGEAFSPTRMEVVLTLDARELLRDQSGCLDLLGA